MSVPASSTQGGTIGLDGIRTRGRDTGYASNVDKPGGLGGKVVVSYPFLFKQAGR